MIVSSYVVQTLNVLLDVVHVIPVGILEHDRVEDRLRDHAGKLRIVMKQRGEKYLEGLVVELRSCSQVAILGESVDVEPVGLVLVDTQKDGTFLEVALVQRDDWLLEQEITVYHRQKGKLHDAVVSS